MITRRSLLRAGAAGLLMPRRSNAFWHGNSVVPSGQFVINLTFDSSTSGAPAGFFTAAQAAATQLGKLIYINKTVDVTIQWGPLVGAPGNQQATGLVSHSQYKIDSIAYSTVKSALFTQAKSANALAAWNTLPSSAPSGASSGVFISWPMQNTMFGTSHVAPYAYAGFASSQNWSYSGAPGAGQIDFNEACLHELTECLGRYSLPGTIFANVCGPLDLFCYSGNGVPVISTTGTRYFSIDSGATNQRTFQNSSDDYGDWSGGGLYSGSPSPFDGSVTSSQLVPLLPCDTLLIDTIGYSSQ